MQVTALLGSIVYKVGLTTMAVPWETARGVPREPQGTAHLDTCYFGEPLLGGLLWVQQES